MQSDFPGPYQDPAIRKPKGRRPGGGELFVKQRFPFLVTGRGEKKRRKQVKQDTRTVEVKRRDRRTSWVSYLLDKCPPRPATALRDVLERTVRELVGGWPNGRSAGTWNLAGKSGDPPRGVEGNGSRRALKEAKKKTLARAGICKSGNGSPPPYAIAGDASFRALRRMGEKHLGVSTLYDHQSVPITHVEDCKVGPSVDNCEDSHRR